MWVCIKLGIDQLEILILELSGSFQYRFQVKDLRQVIHQGKSLSRCVAVRKRGSTGSGAAQQYNVRTK